MPFSPIRIKYLIWEKGETLTTLAEQWHCRMEELSMCIRQVPGRVYPHLRVKIANLIGQPVEKVFGVHPLTTELQSKKRKRRAA